MFDARADFSPFLLLDFGFSVEAFDGFDDFLAFVPVLAVVVLSFSTSKCSVQIDDCRFSLDVLRPGRLLPRVRVKLSMSW